MNGRTTAQIETEEAEEIITRLKAKADSGMVLKACTPAAHVEVVDATRELCRGQVWLIRHARASQADPSNNENVKVNLFGLVKVSAKSAQAAKAALTGSYRIVLVLVAMWMFAKFSPTTLKKQIMDELTGVPDKTQSVKPHAKKIDNL